MKKRFKIQRFLIIRLLFLMKSLSTQLLTKTTQSRSPGIFNFFACRKKAVKTTGESFLISAGFIFFAVFISQFMFAATLSCNIIDADNCASPNITVFRMLNDTSGYFNAHLQNTSLSGYSPIYNYSLCCSSDSTLGSSCSEAVVLKLSNFTNAHAQFGNYTGPNTTYDYSSCLSASPGEVMCTYSSSSCTAGYSCVASMASSEAWAANQTNAHVGPCSEYDMKVCCKVNSPPVISNVTLNSTYDTNYTYENLTVYFSESDDDGDAYTNVTDWRKGEVSIAVLNMAFNTNTSSTASGAIRDYSSFGNDGTLGNGVASQAPVWTSGGKVGGAYEFDGLDDRIIITGLEDNQTYGGTYGNVTVTAWVRPTNNNRYNMVTRGLGGFSYLSAGYTSSGGKLRAMVKDTVNDVNNWPTSTGTINSGEWSHIVFIFEGGRGYKFYINGQLDTETSNPNLSLTNYYSSNNGLGGLVDSTSYFNGTMDEVAIFNRSLSAGQIKAIYNAGVGNKSVQMMHSDETTKGEVWSVAVTGNDGFDDGTTVLSNSLTIRGSVPNVTLLSPPDGNETRSRAPLFEWNATDFDGDSMTYEINITEVKFAGQFVCDDDVYAYPGVMNYTPASDLKCFYDNNYYYLWSVRANDSDGFSEWAGPWKLNMTAVVDMSMPVDFISFGQLSLLQDDNTTDNSPEPFNLQNDGNALINVNVTGTNLWDSIANPNEYYKFKINNNSAELGAFNWSSSATVWTSLPLATSNATGIMGLKYQNAFDSAIIDILVQVPPAEPPGNKTSTITFMSILAE